MSVSDSIVIDADPQVVYANVSDVAQMGRWSPENRGARVDAGGDVEVGTTFVGANKRGPARWVTRCRVTDADPGRRFAFDVIRFGFLVPWLPVRIARWQYDFEPVEGGCRVTETWRDLRERWPDAVTSIFDPIATGRDSFADFQRGNIHRTLRNLKAEIEDGSGS